MTLRKSQHLILVALAALVVGVFLSATSGHADDFDTFNVQANNDKQISLEGYMRLPVAAMVSDTMLVDLYDNPDGKGKAVPVSIYVGSGKNQVEKPPKDYTDKDFKLHANDGSLVTMKDKVRVSGKLIYSPSSSIFYKPIDIQKI